MKDDTWRHATSNMPSSWPLKVFCCFCLDLEPTTNLLEQHICAHVVQVCALYLQVVELEPLLHLLQQWKGGEGVREKERESERERERERFSTNGRGISAEYTFKRPISGNTLKGALKGTNLRGQTEHFRRSSLIFCRFSPFQMIWETQIFESRCRTKCRAQPSIRDLCSREVVASYHLNLNSFLLLQWWTEKGFVWGFVLQNTKVWALCCTGNLNARRLNRTNQLNCGDFIPEFVVHHRLLSRLEHLAWFGFDHFLSLPILFLSLSRFLLVSLSLSSVLNLNLSLFCSQSLSLSLCLSFLSFFCSFFLSLSLALCFQDAQQCNRQEGACRRPALFRRGARTPSRILGLQACW